MMSAILDKIIFTGLILTLVLTALAHGVVEPWSVALFELTIVALILLAGAKSFFDKKISLTIPQPALPLLALLALGLIQSISLMARDGRISSLSMDVEATKQTTAMLFFITAIFVIVANTFSSRERLHTLANILVVYGLVMAIFALIQHFTWNGRFYWIRPNTLSASPFGPFVNHNHFAGYMAMLIPLPIAFAIIKREQLETRVFYIFAAAVMCIATLASLSRGGIISLAVAVVIVALWGWNRRGAGKSRAKERSSKLSGLIRRAALAITILAAVGVGFVWIGPDRLADRLSKGNVSGQSSPRETFYESRGWIWEDTLRMIGANPFLGVGLGAYETAYPIYRKEDRELTVGQAHNDYLQILADGGIVGGLIAVWFIFLILRAISRGIASQDPIVAALALGSGGAIFAMMIHSFVDFNLQLPSNALLFLLQVAVASNAAIIARGQIARSQPRSNRVSSQELMREQVMPSATVR